VFQHYDTDGNGAINYTELLKAVTDFISTGGRTGDAQAASILKANSESLAATFKTCRANMVGRRQVCLVPSGPSTLAPAWSNHQTTHVPKGMPPRVFLHPLAKQRSDKLQRCSGLQTLQPFDIQLGEREARPEEVLRCFRRVASKLYPEGPVQHHYQRVHREDARTPPRSGRLPVLPSLDLGNMLRHALSRSPLSAQHPTTHRLSPPGGQHPQGRKAPGHSAEKLSDTAREFGTYSTNYKGFESKAMRQERLQMRNPQVLWR